MESMLQISSANFSIFRWDCGIFSVINCREFTRMLKLCGICGRLKSEMSSVAKEIFELENVIRVIENLCSLVDTGHA